SGDIISNLALRVDTLEQQATDSAATVWTVLNATDSAAAASDAARLASTETQLSTLRSQVDSLSREALAKWDQLSTFNSQLISTASDTAMLKNILESPLFTSLTASQSAGLQLALEQLDVHDATVSGTLAVTGRTLLADVGITGNLNIGLLSITGLDSCSPLDKGELEGISCASINTLSGPLKLQSDGLNGLDILNGKIAIDTKGNITTQGEITAKKINIDTTDTLSASLGEGTIPVGSSSAVIETTTVTAKSRIFLTPKTKITVPLSVTSQTAGNSFKVETVTPVSQNVKFNWWIVN
ncbi:hypothetical protein KKF69_01570, partial [Patescibacteria group bacterium]|nr:hypothetical protein [Patescibacteria group bacterium]